MNYVWIGKLLACFTWVAENNSQWAGRWAAEAAAASPACQQRPRAEPTSPADPPCSACTWHDPEHARPFSNQGCFSESWALLVYPVSSNINFTRFWRQWIFQTSPCFLCSGLVLGFVRLQHEPARQIVLWYSQLLFLPFFSPHSLLWPFQVYSSLHKGDVKRAEGKDSETPAKLLLFFR